jgi:hypothetical protein
MKKLEIVFRFTLPAAFTWLLIFISAVLPVESMWGINSAKFILPVWLIVVCCVAGLLLASYPLVFDEPVVAEGRLPSSKPALGGYSFRNYLIIAAFAGVVFFLLRIDTYFLGDGYNWISNFSQADYYVAKFTEPLSTRLVRLMQSALGEYSAESAILSFQTLSILSGVVATFFALRLIGILVTSPAMRLVGLILWFGSGGMLLFFGYPEFYSPVWATGVAVLYYSVSFIMRASSVWPALFLFILAMSMHLQAAYLAPAILFLLYLAGMRRKMFGGARQFKRVLRVALAVLALAGLFLFLSFYDTIHAYFLPLIIGRPNAPNYAMFSSRHISDVFNLVLIVIPSFVALYAAGLGGSKPAGESKEIRSFFQLALVGSLTFLFTIDPVLGMARDWDLFSFTMAPLMFYTLYKLHSGQIRVPKAVIVNIALISVFVTGSYIATNESRSKSVGRYHELLNLYGSKHRGGWTILAEYHEERGEVESGK